MMINIVSFCKFQQLIQCDKVEVITPIFSSISEILFIFLKGIKYGNINQLFYTFAKLD